VARPFQTAKMRVAITRDVSPAIARCELTHLEREPIDAARAARQHTAYADVLARLGCDVKRLPAEPDLPDSVFVEDGAVVLDELAVATRPGARSRRAEVASLVEALRPYREVVAVGAPGTLDGGDVLRIDRDLYVGLSSRTDAEGIERLRELVAPHGYVVHAVEVEGCLHLKSAATLVARDTLLVNPDWVERGAFGEREWIEVDPAEPFGANALLVGETVVFAEAFPRTRERLEERGIRVVGVDVSELGKAEGGVTCCSLVFGG